LSPDAFVHLPQLSTRVTPPAHSPLRVTPEVLAAWDEQARRLGRAPNWRLPDAEVEASRRALLGTLDGRHDLWVFAYGSLMWDPGFHFAEVRLAELAGWQRCFSFKSTLGRGSTEHPALMLSLEPQADGRCGGLAFRIEAAAADAETTVLWRREMLRGSYHPLRVPLATPQGDLHAIAFASNPAHPDHVGRLPIADAAAYIAQAQGIIGSNREYLEQLAAQLDRLGVRCHYTSELLAAVHAATAPPGAKESARQNSAK